MSKFKFTELSLSAQKTAIRDYIEGLKETRDEDDLNSEEEVFYILSIDLNDECLYNKKGVFLEESYD